MTLQPKRNSVWYKLAGKSEQALRRAIEASQNGEELGANEKKELATLLGYYAPVAQTVCWFGPEEDYAVFPATFGHPFSNTDEFYMKCPIGRTKAEEETHFVPEDGVALSDDEADKLEMALFPPQGASVPITEREPIPLQRKAEPLPPSPK